MNKEELISLLDFEIENIRSEEASTGTNEWLFKSGIAGSIWIIATTIKDYKINLNLAIACFVLGALLIFLKDSIRACYRAISVKLDGDGIYSVDDFFHPLRKSFFTSFVYHLLLFVLSVYCYQNGLARSWQEVTVFGLALVGTGVSILSTRFKYKINLGKEQYFEDAIIPHNVSKKFVNGFLKGIYLLMRLSIFIYFILVTIACYESLQILTEIKGSFAIEIVLVVILCVGLHYAIGQYLVVLARNPFVNKYIRLRREVSLSKSTPELGLEEYLKIRDGEDPIKLVSVAIENFENKIEIFKNEIVSKTIKKQITKAESKAGISKINSELSQLEQTLFLAGFSKSMSVDLNDRFESSRERIKMYIDMTHGYLK